jgi:ribosomal protein S1
MIEVGSVIAVEATQIVPYGVWFRHQGEKGLVLITDLSWEPVHDPSEIVHVGQTFDVKAIRYNYKNRQIVGSLKALEPEKNPYRKLARLEPGTILEGRVSTTSNGDTFVYLPYNTCGHIPTTADRRELKPGERVKVSIASLEVDEGRLVLNLEPENRDANIPSETHLVSV